MKKTKTFSVDETTYTLFEEYCEKNNINKSQIIEKKIMEFIKENKSTSFAAVSDEINSIVEKILINVKDFIKNDEAINEILNTEGKIKYNLTIHTVENNKQREIRLTVHPVLVLDKTYPYVFKLDDDYEPVHIVNNDHEFVELDNGNKIRIIEFLKTYEKAYYSDPIDFLYKGGGEDVSEEEKQQVLEDFNKPSIDIKKVKDIVSKIDLNKIKDDPKKEYYKIENNYDEINEKIQEICSNRENPLEDDIFEKINNTINKRRAEEFFNKPTVDIDKVKEIVSKIDLDSISDDPVTEYPRIRVVKEQEVSEIKKGDSIHFDIAKENYLASKSNKKEEELRNVIDNILSRKTCNLV